MVVWVHGDAKSSRVGRGAASSLDPDALCRAETHVAGWEPEPHFASVVTCRVPASQPETHQSENSMTDSNTPESSSFEAASEALSDARREVLQVPAEVIVVNHAYGLYELAALHLTAEQPDLPSAALAIDALGCLVEGLAERLGGAHPELTEALGTIRMAFVQVKSGLS